MKNFIGAFIRGVSVNAWSKAGIVLVTVSVILFTVYELLEISGILTNAYIGLITYLGFPLLFVIGLLAIPIGWVLYARKKQKPLKQMLFEKFDEEELRESQTGARLFRTVTLLTLLNLIILGVASSRMLHYMDSAHFCGTACHSVMNPEWVTYQQSPHARVHCVECHVGEGTKALVDSKINGIWQMISVTFNLYERPIPTPVHTLRPARETCEKCHWPEKFIGNRIVNRAHYLPDSTNSASHTTLMLKVGTGGEGVQPAGSHWHISDKNTVRYASVDDKREQIMWVEVQTDSGSFKRFTNTTLSDYQNQSDQHIRTMDCVDCHNRATHIYEELSNAIDKRILTGEIDKNIPFIRKQVEEVLSNHYPDLTSARNNIRMGIANFYKRSYPKIATRFASQIDQAIESTINIYIRNIHTNMNITWGSYRSHIGHSSGAGCFRCHTPSMQNDSGKSISMDCTLCHSILAYESEKPFEFIQEINTDSLTLEDRMQLYLEEEFWQSVNK